MRSDDTPIMSNGMSQFELDVLLHEVRGEFDIDNEDNPRATPCHAFLSPDTDDDGNYNGGFEITLVVNGLIFTFNHAQADHVCPMLPPFKAREIPASAVVIPIR